MLITNLLYILQSENYEIKRFLSFSYSHLNWWDLQKRKKIEWTKKARLIHVISFFSVAIIIFLAIWTFGYLGLLAALVLYPCLPLIIIIALIVVYPLDIYLKNRIIFRAKEFIKSQEGRLIVVGITGSYGKTSTKEILLTILKEKFRVIATTGNINTDVGIANFILKNKEGLSGSEIFIVEMGAFRLGEIKKICNIVRPTYSILTGINESHLEKFGSLENTIKTKFELPEATKEESYLNIKDKNIENSFRNFVIKKPIVNFLNIDEIKELDNFQGLEFRILKTTFLTRLLAKHSIDLISLCVELATKLGMSLELIANGVKKINHIVHRLEPIYNNASGILVIDDSYNGNFNGFKSGLEVLGRAKGRKIVLTPGLVEQGKRTREVHIKIGEMYADNKVDLVILVKSKVSDYLIEGMENNEFTSYKIYNTTSEAHADLENILKRGDTIIFQNDWPDNYF